eukprot:TRINITY_DN2753_c0_g1_i3.p1 TRINITY_DN2753_c0_g1~~TRINITY_DN2753_c0_g1_i3.p1  ORF type:complete len:143 (+),score=30.79 TRINITY_DN2753_c0_g1_i3:224-652(+)
MTQYPDVNHGTVKGVPIKEVIKDERYLREEFVTKVQKRGGEVLTHRKISSVMSAAQAIKDHIKNWLHGTPEHEFVSMGVYSEGWYSVPKDIFFSFPVKCRNGTFEVVTGLKIDEFSESKIRNTADELIAEKEEALGLEGNNE